MSTEQPDGGLATENQPRTISLVKSNVGEPPETSPWSFASERAGRRSEGPVAVPAGHLNGSGTVPDAPIQVSPQAQPVSSQSPSLPPGYVPPYGNPIPAPPTPVTYNQVLAHGSIQHQMSHAPIPVASYRPAPNAPYNGMAVASVSIAIAGLVIPFVFLVAIIFGHIGLQQTIFSGERGRGAAIAGLIIGYGVLAVILLTMLVIASLLYMA